MDEISKLEKTCVCAERGGWREMGPRPQTAEPEWALHCEGPMCEDAGASSESCDLYLKFGGGSKRPPMFGFGKAKFRELDRGTRTIRIFRELNSRWR